MRVYDSAVYRQPATLKVGSATSSIHESILLMVYFFGDLVEASCAGRHESKEWRRGAQDLAGEFGMSLQSVGQN